MGEQSKQEKFINRLTAMWGNQYDYSHAVYVDAKTKVEVFCPKHGTFWITPNAIYHGQVCRKCGLEKRRMPNKRTTESFISACMKIFGDKYDYSKTIYTKANDKVIITCKKHGDFERIAEDLIQGKGCPKCSFEESANRMAMGQDEFIRRMKQLYGDSYDYSLVDYKASLSKVKIICKKHGVFETRPSTLLNGHECPKCASEKQGLNKRSSFSEFVEKARKAHGDKYTYFEDTYNGTHQPTKILCPIHGEFWQIAKGHTSGQECPKCNSSHGEKAVRQWLITNNIKFEEQKRFEECRYKKKLSFDFYLPSQNICIEFQGIQHYENIGHFNRNGKSLELNQKRDTIKREFCKNNSIELIEIKYNEDVSEVLNAKLLKEEI